jgi:PAS domain S-box-containing protein
LISKDGARVELLIRGTPIIVDGRSVGVFGVAEDITERKRSQRALDENESHLQLALEAGQMGLWTWDLESQVVILDSANCQLFGIDRAKSTLSTEELFLRMHPDDINVVRRQFDAMIEGHGDYNAEFRVLLPEGQVRWLAGRGRVVRDGTGKAVQVVGVNFDVTQHQVATEQLNMARIAAETASRTKDNFIAALSHELRTPLNPVLILASDQERNPDLNPELRADFGMVRKNVELEAHLIDDLLDLTRIARGKLRLDLRVIDLQALCHDAIEVLRADLKAKGLKLLMECSATHRWVSGDAVRLQQVLWNLLKNAVKFTPVGGQIQVDMCDQNGGSILIRLRDTGIGIDQENLEKIFDAFEQGDAGINRRFGGLGLGLAISRTLVEMHGGRIWATSEGRDHGTCFHLELPAADPAELPLSVPAAADQEFTPKRILLVEDDEATRITLERLLTRRDHEVVAVSTTAAARQAVRCGQFDIIISDLGLPDGSGHELMTHLRDIPGLRGIALSGYGMEEDIARSHASGFALHLTKPIDIRALDRAIATVSLAPEVQAMP